MSISAMAAVILAGGRGTRISEYSDAIPKPLVPIGGRPIISHIIDSYVLQGVKEFYVAGGYKIEELKKYFALYHLFNSDFCVSTKDGGISVLGSKEEDVSISVIDTGVNTQTGGRVKKLEGFLCNKPFFLTYGDGVSDVDLAALLDQHKALGTQATITAVHPSSRYGKIEFDEKGWVSKFSEKPEFGEDWINGGFMVMEPSIFDYFSSDEDVLETVLLKALAEEGKLGCYRHNGFWKSMDTLRDKRELDKLIEDGNMPWLGDSDAA